MDRLASSKVVLMALKVLMHWALSPPHAPQTEDELYRTRSLGHQIRLRSGRVFRCGPASAQASRAVAPVLFR